MKIIGDILFTNGVIYSLEAENERFGAMLVRNKKIVSMYVEPWPDVKASQVIDLGGKSLLPGFIDSHVHFMMTVVAETMGRKVSYLDGDRIAPADMNGIKNRLQAIAADKNKNQPLLFYNYVISAVVEKRLPEKGELDLWFPGRTVSVISMDGHSSSHSTKALENTGLEDPRGDGILTGEAHEFNMGKINSYIQSRLSIALLLKGLTDVTADALAHGITGIQCLEGFDDDPADRSLWFMTRIAAALPLKLRLSMQYLDPGRCDSYGKFLKQKQMGGCGAWEMDGSVSSQTAAFNTDYKGRSGHQGQCYYTQEQVNLMVQRAQDAGYRLSVHAIGTAAIERILKAFEKAANHYYPIKPMRHGIDHFEFPSHDQVKRAVAAGLMLVPQPGFAWFDAKYQKTYSQFLTDSVIKMQIPLKTIANLGGFILGSSDSPVQPLNPFIQIQGMVTFPVTGESLSLYQALRTYTYNGAYALREEDERGTLTAGKYADFIILDRDPFQVPIEDIHKLEVAETWINGHRLYPDKTANAWTLLIRGLLGIRQKL